MQERSPEYIIVYVTAPNADEAASIGSALVEARLAACVNVVNAVRSIYRWKGGIEDDSEVLLISKTRADLFEAFSERVRALHSYETPEIIAVPVVAGSDDYLKWIDESTKND